MAKGVYFVNWDAAPHLSKEAKETMLASIPPWQRKSRIEGIPQFGTGNIYTTPENEFVINPIPLETHWHRCYGFDPGKRIAAAVFGAFDRDSQTLYIYDEIYKSQAEPAILAQAIKSRGDWIPGVMDYAGANIRDHQSIVRMYQELGLDVRAADKTVEAGLMKVWEWLSEGRIKVFNTCQNFLAEYRLYRRDEKGNVVKENDHAMDAWRYLVMSGLNRAIAPPSGSTGKEWWNWEPKYNIFVG